MQKSTLCKGLVWISLLLFSRMMPHLSNFSPYSSLVLLSGCEWKKSQALVLTLAGLLISDIALALMYGYSVFGLWSIFTYSGFLAMALGSVYCLGQRRSGVRVALYAISSLFGYWLWTNFGTWLSTDLYAHSLVGLGACLIAGLPFLQNSLLAGLVFVPCCGSLMVFLEKKGVLCGA